MAEYDDKRALIYAHVHSFASLPRSKSESGTELKKLRDSISRVRRAVESRMSHQSVGLSPSIHYLRKI